VIAAGQGLIQAVGEVDEQRGLKHDPDGNRLVLQQA
jgi:hypothetical protein